VDRGEAVVAGRGAVTAPGFEVVEERPDERGVDIGDIEPRGRCAELLLGEAQQQAEGVAVGGDGVRAGPALGQPLGEVGLQDRGERGHGWPSR
jgi:hypothetical protein